MSGPPGFLRRCNVKDIKNLEDIESKNEEIEYIKNLEDVESNNEEIEQFILTQDMQDSHLASLVVTDDEITQISNLPQRTEGWFKARRARMTGSIIGAAVGHNYFCRPTELLSELLWRTFEGNAATEYGTKMEPIAADIYERWSGNIVEYPGLVVCKEKPWLGMSPDGVFVEKGIRGLLEIKCPFRKKFYGRIPMYYYDQIQFGMWVLKCKFCDFVVYTPTQTKIERFTYNAGYVEEFLIERVDRFYFNRYMPLFLLQEMNMLQEGEVTVPDHVEIEFVHPPVQT